MKKPLIALIAALVSVTALAGPKSSEPLRCTGAKSVKLFVGYVAETEDRTEWGQAFVCWDREVDSQEEIRRLQSSMTRKGVKLTILSVKKLQS